eukprot:gene4968-biopygen10468
MPSTGGRLLRGQGTEKTGRARHGRHRKKWLGPDASPEASWFFLAYRWRHCRNQVEVALCAEGVPEEHVRTAPPGEPRRPQNTSRAPLGKPYQTNGFLKAPLQRHCGCLSAYAVGSYYRIVDRPGSLLRGRDVVHGVAAVEEGAVEQRGLRVDGQHRGPLPRVLVLRDAPSPLGNNQISSAPAMEGCLSWKTPPPPPGCTRDVGATQRRLPDALKGMAQKSQVGSMRRKKKAGGMAGPPRLSEEPCRAPVAPHRSPPRPSCSHRRRPRLRPDGRVQAVHEHE